MPSEDLPSAVQAEMSLQKAFVLRQPEGNVFVMDVLDYPIRLVRLEGVTRVFPADLCKACGMRWEAQQQMLDAGLSHRFSLHSGRYSIVVSLDEAFDYLNRIKPNSVKHPEKLLVTLAFVQGLI